MDSKKQFTSEYFSKNSSYWKLVYEEESSPRSFLTYEMQLRKNTILDIISNISTTGPLNILDCGCGAGILIKEGSLLGHSMIGVDISFGMINSTKNACKTSGSPAFNVVVGDVENLAFKNDHFDVIICAGVLQYLKEDKSAILEFSRLLKDGGILILTLPNIFTIGNILDPYYYFYRLPQLILFKINRLFAKIKKKEKTNFDFHSNRDFSNRHYYFQQLYKELYNNKMIVKRSYAIAFGPLSLFKKQLFRLNLSLNISKVLSKMAETGLFNFVNYFANRWVFYIEKK